MEKPFKDCKFILNKYLQPYEDQIIKSPGILANPNAANLIETNWTQIKDTIELHHGIGQNPSLVHLIEPLCENEVKIFNSWWLRLRNIFYKFRFSWLDLCRNPKALHIIERHIPFALNYLPQQKCALAFDSLCNNPSPKAMDLIDRYWTDFTKLPVSYNTVVSMSSLLINPNAVKLIEKHWTWIINTYSINILHYIFCNPNAVHLIDQHWDMLVANNKLNVIKLFSNTNPNTVDLIDRHWDWLLANGHINWHHLCNKATGGELIDRHWDEFIAHINSEPDVHAMAAIFTMFYDTPQGYINGLWCRLCLNQHAVKLLNKRWNWMVEHNVVNYWALMENPAAVDLIEHNWDWLLINGCIHWSQLWQNPNACHLIDQNWNLVRNKLQFMVVHDNAASITLFKNHWNDVKHILCNINWWSKLLYAPNIMELVGPNIEWIVANSNEYWLNITKNPAIFDDEYFQVATKYMRSHVFAELMARIWHPRNIARFPDLGIDPDA